LDFDQNTATSDGVNLNQVLEVGNIALVSPFLSAKIEAVVRGVD